MLAATMTVGKSTHPNLVASSAVLWPGAVVAFVLCAGCGTPKSGPIAPEQTALSWLGTMYGMYIGQHGGETPKSADDLRKFVEKTVKPDTLSRLKVSNVEGLFVSPRDGKPYVLVSYAKLPPPVGGQPAPIALCEAEGQGGKRAVAFVGGNTQQVTEQELQKLLPPKK